MKNKLRRIKLPQKTALYLKLQKRGILDRSIKFFKPRCRPANEFILVLSAHMYFNYEKQVGEKNAKLFAVPDLSQWVH